MGVTRCHIKGIFSSAATRWQIVLHGVVFAHRQQFSIGKSLLLTIRAVMLEEHVDLVAGDFNGAAWRRQCGNALLSIIEGAFADSDLPRPPGPTPLWGPGGVPGERADVCGFSQVSRLLWKMESTSGVGCGQVPTERWKVRRGAFSIPHDTLGLRPKDQSCHHEVWLHLAFVPSWRQRTARKA